MHGRISNRLGPVAVLALAACASGNPSFGPPPADLLETETGERRIASRLRVIGTVHDPAGNPVAGARVHVQAHPRTRCAGGRGALGTARVRRDGWFIKTLYFYSFPATPSCVTVRVTPPATSTLAPDSATNIFGEFRHGAGIDTVFVWFRLRRSAATRRNGAGPPGLAPGS